MFKLFFNIRTSYLMLLMLVSTTIFGCCNKQATQEVTQNVDTMKLKITVGQTVFRAALFDNATVKAFRERLPFTINMADLNGNEKYFDLSKSLPANASSPGIIENGDLMLYGSRTLVLFYKTFPTSYSYTRVGRIDNPSGLAAALGNNDVTLTFTFEK